MEKYPRPMPLENPDNATFREIAVPGGLQLVQHDTVLSELRFRPGPTHSVFDLLAALAVVLPDVRRLALLGFAGGGVIAPIRALGSTARVDTVDLDPAGHACFQRHCRDWAGDVRWQQADAVDWLESAREPFDLIIDDLSVEQGGAVHKPAVSWDNLPPLMASKVKPGGFVMSNQLRPADGTWVEGEKRFATNFNETIAIHLDAFDNRILVSGDQLPPVRRLSADLNRVMERLASRQAGRFHLRTIRIG